jgi:hypothetical protein
LGGLFKADLKMQIKEPKFTVGCIVEIDAPGKAEHGAAGLVRDVVPWSGPEDWDTFEYTCDFTQNGHRFRATVGERMLKQD